MTRIFALFLVLTLCAGDVRAQDPVDESAAMQMTPEQMAEDIQAWKTNLEQNHPGVYRFIDEETMSAEIRTRQTQLDGPLSVVEFYRVLAELNAMIGCGHTPINLPGPARARLFRGGATLPPLSVAVLGPRIFVRAALGDATEPPAGAEIVSINGYGAADILETMYARYNSDGANRTRKRWRAEAIFPIMYVLLVDSSTASYRIEYRDDAGAVHTSTAAGVELDTMMAAATPGPDQFLSLDILKEDRTAVLTVASFSGGRIEQAGQEFVAFIKDAFRQMRDEDISNVVIDVRGNTGGTDGFGTFLVSQLVSEPFRYFERIEVTAAYDSRGDPKTDDQGRRVITSHPPLGMHQPADDPFKGDVYVLTDGGTFSTAADFSATVHRLGRATFVGEETGGGYIGNTSGPGNMATLPNSKIMAPASFWMYTNPEVDPKHIGHGVRPDHEVTPTIRQLLDGEDAALNRTLSLIRENAR